MRSAEMPQRHHRRRSAEAPQETPQRRHKRRSAEAPQKAQLRRYAVPQKAQLRRCAAPQKAQLRRSVATQKNSAYLYAGITWVKLRTSLEINLAVDVYPCCVLGLVSGIMI